MFAIQILLNYLCVNITENIKIVNLALGIYCMMGMSGWLHCGYLPASSIPNFSILNLSILIWSINVDQVGNWWSGSWQIGNLWISSTLPIQRNGNSGRVCSNGNWPAYLDLFWRWQIQYCGVSPPIWLPTSLHPPLHLSHPSTILPLTHSTFYIVIQRYIFVKLTHKLWQTTSTPRCQWIYPSWNIMITTFSLLESI